MPKTINEIKSRKYIGKDGDYTVFNQGKIRGKMVIKVRIIDTKEIFGRIEFLISPIVGTGELWTSKVTNITK